MRKNKRHSFTLVEAVIVAGLFSLVGLAVLNTFISGSKIWQRVYQEDLKGKMSIFLEEFTKDVTNMLAMKESFLFGSQTFLEFPTLIAYPAHFGPIKRGPGKVSYAFFLDEGALRKTIRTVNDIYRNNPGTAHTVLENVTDCSLSYYYFDNESKSYLWLNEWSYNFLPLAVSLRVSVRHGSTAASFNKKIFIPAQNVKKTEKKET